MHPLLGVRSDFSLGESLISVSDLTTLAADLKQEVVAVADTMSVSSLIEASKACDKAGVKFIPGVRLRIVERAEREKKLPTCHIKLFPTNEKGMQCLFRLLSRAFDDDRMYFQPRLTWGDLHDLIEDDCLIVSTDSTQSALERDCDAQALTDLASAKSFSERFYELVPCPTPYFSRHNKRAVEWGDQNEFKPLLCQPVLWQGDDRVAYSLMASITNNMPFDDYLDPQSDFSAKGWAHLSANLRDAIAAVKDRYDQNVGREFAAAIRNTQVFADAATYKWQKQEPCLPVLADDPDAVLMGLCKKGVKERFSKPFLGHKPTSQEIKDDYLPRLKSELATLKRLGFAQYFLLVSDLVRWAKSKNIYVGPGRGSVGGSLVAYLCGITDVDPIRFNLLFERFINPDRLDLPDADLDFMSTRREEVIDYLEETYGEENVAGIVNYNALGSRSALRDMARIKKLPPSVMDLTKFIEEVHGVQKSLSESRELSAEIKDFADRNPDLWKQACVIEGKMRAFGTHAAGIVVASEPLINRAVIEKRGGARVINWDKRTSEEQGLIKLDVLGLSNLDVFDRAVKMIFKRHSVKIDINQIELDDAETLEIFNEARTHGIFQFEGGSVRRLLQQMAKTASLTFEDLVALNALNRPGPLDAGLTDSYIKRRAGLEPVTYPHPSLQDILEPTYGVLTYQEQVMQTARVLCGFTGGEADTLRKIMGKKLPEEMAKQRDKFVDGALATSNMPNNEAGALFDQIEKFAGYAFNRSHAVEYTLISYQAAYLKARYPVEFYSAAMDMANPDKLLRLVRAARKDGISVNPPDINISTTSFEPLNDTTITAPLSAVKHVSAKGAHAIVRARETEKELEFTEGRGKKKRTWTEKRGPGPFKSIEDFRERLAKKDITARGLSNLDKVGAFARVEPGQLPANDPSRQKDQIEIMEELADQAVPASRTIPMTPEDNDAMRALRKEIEEDLGIGVTVPPAYGRDAKFAVVLDHPFTDHTEPRKAYSMVEYIAPALGDAGLSFDDAAWLWLAKRARMEGEKAIPADENAASAPWLDRELEIMKPPVIVVLGNAANRHFFPGIKKISEKIGNVKYSAERDASIIIGFNPGQLYFSPGKRADLAEIFKKAAALIE